MGGSGWEWVGVGGSGWEWVGVGGSGWEWVGVATTSFLSSLLCHPTHCVGECGGVWESSGRE